MYSTGFDIFRYFYPHTIRITLSLYIYVEWKYKWTELITSLFSDNREIESKKMGTASWVSWPMSNSSISIHICVVWTCMARCIRHYKWEALSISYQITTKRSRAFRIIVFFSKTNSHMLRDFPTLKSATSFCTLARIDN